MARQKTLTEGGDLKQYNMQGSSIRPSTRDYKIGLNSFFLQKELREYVSRFKWSGLPDNLDANIMETMLYYKGQLAMFKIGQKYYILPFVYTGPINQYGIQNKLIPISFSGVLDGSKKDKVDHFASEMEAMFYDKGEIPDENFAIVIKAHSGMYLNNVIPDIVITDEIRDKLAENMILIRNNLILSQPIKYVPVVNQAAGKSMDAQIDNMFYDILNGRVVKTIVGKLALEDFNSEPPNAQSQIMWQSFASLDNLRMEYLGILNNGVFEKRERNLTDEVAGKQTVAKLLLDDALQHRKRFCVLINKYFKLNVSVDLSDMTISMYQPEKDNPDKREEKQLNKGANQNDGTS